METGGIYLKLFICSCVFCCSCCSNDVDSVIVTVEVFELDFCFGIRSQPLSGGERLKRAVSRVGGVGHYLSCLRQSPGGVGYRSWTDGRFQPITFSAERLICCSLPLSLVVAAAY